MDKFGVLGANMGGVGSGDRDLAAEEWNRVVVEDEDATPLHRTRLGLGGDGGNERVVCAL
jgi:hypothetical protein